MDYEELMARAAEARQRMRELEAATGLFFPFRVRLEVAIETIGDGLASACGLEVAVGYLMLRELVDEAGSAPAPLN